MEVLHKTIPPASRATLYPETGPTVLRTMFETHSLPEGWASIVARFDRVWVPGAFNAETFARAGVPEHKLRRLPQTLDFATLLAARDDPFELPDTARGMRFLSVFDFSERKAWRTLLDAWADAFGPLDDVSLVLKCGNLVMGVTDARERIAAHLGERRTAPIVLIEDCLSTTAIARLYHACDAFVLPSRGEGWGRPFMEAMAVGLPTIGPDWGGSREFMSEANAFLVGGQVVAVRPGELVFERYAGQRWFEPRRDELTAAMRTVAERGAEVARRAACAAHEIRRALQPRAPRHPAGGARGRRAWRRRLALSGYAASRSARATSPQKSAARSATRLTRSPLLASRRADGGRRPARGHDCLDRLTGPAAARRRAPADRRLPRRPNSRAAWRLRGANFGLCALCGVDGVSRLHLTRLARPVGRRPAEEGAYGGWR